MAGEGLIWSALGQGIANAGSTMGQYMFKDIASDEARQDRMDLQRERIAASEEQKRRDREMRLSIEESRRDRSGGGGAAIGLDAEELAPGGKLAGMVAGKLGMSEPEYKKLYESRKTGDKSAYETTTEGGSIFEGELGGTQVLPSKSLPKGFEAEYKAKNKALADLEESYALTNRYDDVMKGRQTGFQTGVGEGILSGEITGKENVGRASRAVGSMLGRDSYKVEGGEKMDVFTGASDTTPLGKAQIAEAGARASELGKLGQKYAKEVEKITAEIEGGMFNKNSGEKLTSMINSANATIKSLIEGGKGATPELKAAWQQQYDDAVSIREKATRLQSNALDVRETPKAERPPSVSDVPGLPPGATSIGAKTAKGWEIKDKTGKLLGYATGR
jgi:hypothetical protein